MSQSNEKTVAFVTNSEETVTMFLNKQLYAVEPGGETQIPVSLIRYIKDRGFPVMVKGEKPKGEDDKKPPVPSASDKK